MKEVSWSTLVDLVSEKRLEYCACQKIIVPIEEAIIRENPCTSRLVDTFMVDWEEL